MTIKQWGKVDNSATQHKAQLRIRNLPKAPAVLDLFCGAGQMYRLAYRDRAKLYHGVDKEKVPDPPPCTLGDNLKYLQKTTSTNSTSLTLTITAAHGNCFT